MSAPNPPAIDATPSTPPKKREPIERPLVRVAIPPNATAAIVYSKDRKIDTTFPAGSLAKRFYPGEVRSGYFKSELFADGVLEIGERVPAPEEPW